MASPDQASNRKADLSNLDALRDRLGAMAEEPPVRAPMGVEEESSALPGSVAARTRNAINTGDDSSLLRRILIGLALVVIVLVLLTRGGADNTEDPAADTDASAELDLDN